MIKTLIKKYGDREASHLIFLLAIFATILAHPFAWALFPSDVDPINFVAALKIYDVGIDSPHPPGYPLYVFFGRLAANLINPFQAYQLVNLIAVILSGSLLYSIGSQLGDKSTGLIASLLWLTHPLVWSATTIQESYIFDACFSLLLVRAWLNAKYFMQWVFVLYLVFCLIRPITGLMLLPLVIALSFLLRKSIAEAVKISLLGCAGFAVAYGLTIWLAGGLEVYSIAAQRVMGSAFKASSMLGGAGPEAHARMLSKLLMWNILFAIPLIAAVLFVKQKEQNINYIIFVGWIGGPLLFFAMVYYLKPTYLLAVLPAYLLLLGLWVGCNWLTIALALAQICFYWFGSNSLPIQAFRLTKSYVDQTDSAWMKITSSLPKDGGKDDLLIWNTDVIPVYAARLLVWSGRVAVKSGDGFVFLEPATMRWLPQQPPIQKLYKLNQDGYVVRSESNFMVSTPQR